MHHALSSVCDNKIFYDTLCYSIRTHAHSKFGPIYCSTVSFLQFFFSFSFRILLFPFLETQTQPLAIGFKANTCRYRHIHKKWAHRIVHCACRYPFSSVNNNLHSNKSEMDYFQWKIEWYIGSDKETYQKTGETRSNLIIGLFEMGSQPLCCKWDLYVCLCVAIE